MSVMRVFVSSVQKELVAERAAVRDFLRGDPLMRRFFEVFLFEEVPAKDRPADALYLDEVARCDVYVGIFGNEYGYEDAQGISPMQREFDRATKQNKPRLIFVKGVGDASRHPKMQALIGRAGSELIRRRFGSTSELVTNIYASLVDYLEAKDLIRTGPFDAAPCPKATLADLDADAMAHFIRTARQSRGFPLQEEGRARRTSDASEPAERWPPHTRGGVALRKAAPTFPDLFGDQVCPLPWCASCQTHPIVSGVQRNGL